jgi:hypothetical protein
MAVLSRVTDLVDALEVVVFADQVELDRGGLPHAELGADDLGLAVDPGGAALGQELGERLLVKVGVLPQEIGGRLEYLPQPCIGRALRDLSKSARYPLRCREADSSRLCPGRITTHSLMRYMFVT